MLTVVAIATVDSKELADLKGIQNCTIGLKYNMVVSQRSTKRWGRFVFSASTFICENVCSLDLHIVG